MSDENQEHQEFFVRINNPTNFRRNLLLASKITLGVLKKGYSLIRIRDTKREMMGMIEHEMKELKVLVENLYELMPKHSKDELMKKFPDVIVREPIKPVQHKDYKEEHEHHHEELHQEHKPIPRPVQRQPSSEIEKLTRALDAVESKLKNL